MLSQLVTGQRTAAPANRVVWPMTQLERTPPAAAPRYIELLLVDVPSADHGIHPGHQVVVVDAGVGLVDGVAERGAVTGRAAGIGVEHHVSVGRPGVPHVVEPDVVHPVGTAVNLQQHRILLLGVEGRWLHDPALDPGPAGRGIPDLLEAGQSLPRHEIVVDPGELGQVDPLLGVRRQLDHVGRHREGGPGAHHHARGRDRADPEDLGLGGDRLHRPSRHRDEHQVDRALVLGVEVDAAPVTGPDQAEPGVAIVGRAQISGSGAVAIHDPQVRDLVGLLDRREAGIGDLGSIRRHRRPTPATPLGGQPLDREAGDVERKDVGVAIGEIGAGIVVAVEVDGLAVGREVPADAERSAFVGSPDAPLAGGELAGRAAVGRNQEEVEIAGLQEPAPVEPVVELVDHPGRRGPLGVGRRWRHLDRPLVRLGNQHAEADRFPVRRPFQAPRRFDHSSDLAGGPLGVHPPDEDLAPAGLLGLGEIGDPGPVGRPDRARALHQESVPGSVGVDDPDRALPAIVDPVDPPAGVDHALAVGGDLRVPDSLEVEILAHGQEGVPGRLLGRPGGAGHQGDGGEGDESSDDGQGPSRTSGASTVERLGQRRSRELRWQGGASA